MIAIESLLDLTHQYDVLLLVFLFFILITVVGVTAAPSLQEIFKSIDHLTLIFFRLLRHFLLFKERTVIEAEYIDIGVVHASFGLTRPICCYFALLLHAVVERAKGIDLRLGYVNA